MNLTSPTWRRLTRDELRLLSTIAYQVGIAIERARLAEKSTELARMEERTRIAREIHDTLAQGLTAIALQVEGALNHVDRRPELARERLERALAICRESLEEARRSVLDLRCAPVARPLAGALRALARSFTSETGVRVEVSTEGETALPLRAEGELLRIAQEALTNVRRHAHADQVDIALAAGPRAVRLSIRDNGAGFDPRGIGEGHHGIVGMKERAKLLGGRLRIDSRPGQGTRVSAVVPVEAQEE
jgi:two-component system NarL family sensor kinase